MCLVRETNLGSQSVQQNLPYLLGVNIAHSTIAIFGIAIATLTVVALVAGASAY